MLFRLYLNMKEAVNIKFILVYKKVFIRTKIYD
jgi:hypothetical protein